MSKEQQGYRGLLVWQKAMTLAENIYRITKLLPDIERYGLCSQMQRAAVSIPCNIAKGYGRGGADYRRFAIIPRGSLMELETQIELTVRLKHLEREQLIDIWNLSQEIGRMMYGLIHSLRKPSNKEDTGS